MDNSKIFRNFSLKYGLWKLSGYAQNTKNLFVKHKFRQNLAFCKINLKLQNIPVN